MMLHDKMRCHDKDLRFLNYRCIEIIYLDCRRSCLPSYHRSVNIKKKIVIVLHSYKIQSYRCAQRAFELSPAMRRTKNANTSLMSDDVSHIIISHRPVMFCSYLQFHLTRSPLLHPIFLHQIFYLLERS